jgi:transcriptional regulator with XRE-family HTH domain
MLIGLKLKEIRESKKLSQGDIEERTGLLRCYTSRVENGHTVPAVETLEKYARALEIRKRHPETDLTRSCVG